MDTIQDVREHRKSFLAYTKHWKTLESASGSWGILSEKRHQKLVVHLLKQIAEDPCKVRFLLLRAALKEARVSSIALAVEPDTLYRTQPAVFSVAIMYFALYYDKVEAKFDTEYFAKHYKEANRF